MKRVILMLGATCSGKSTIGRKAAVEVNASYVSFGECRRRAERLGDDVAASLRDEPIDPDTGAKFLSACLPGGLSIVSGFPVTLREMHALSEQGVCQVVGWILIDVDATVAHQRFIARGVCPICAEPGRSGDKCSADGSSLVPRADASAAEFSRRQAFFSDTIVPFVAHLKALPIPSLRVDASQADQALSLDEVYRFVTRTFA